MSAYSELFVFVEGPDDERFINSVILSRWLKKYDNVRIIRYACKPQSEIANLVSVVKKKDSWDYLFMCDMDARGDKSICITSRKERENKKFNNVLEIKKIIIVKEEIESWYLSGIVASKTNKYKIKHHRNTESVTKEEFRKMLPKRFDSVSDFMIEILKDFNLEEAISVNNSLDYFFQKYL